MKFFTKIFLVYLWLINSLGYIIAWHTLLNPNEYNPNKLTENIYKNIYISIVYYIEEISHWWWVYILDSSLFLTWLTTIVYGYIYGIKENSRLLKLFNFFFLIYLAVTNLLFYILIWGEFRLTGNIYKDIYTSIINYIGALFYGWWFYLLNGNLLLALVTAIACEVYLRLRKNSKLRDF